MPKTRNAIGILEKLTGSNRAVRSGIARAHTNFEIAQMIYTTRSQAGLSQTALAEAVGTKHSVITRLENADYQGHSLAMLQLIAEALNQRLEVRFAARMQNPRSGKRKAA